MAKSEVLIENIEIAKKHGKKSVIIEKQTSKFPKKNSSFKSSGFKAKSTFSFNKSQSLKQSFPTKTPNSVSDFERRKLAEQRATKKIKIDTDKDKKTKLGTKKRQVKLTVSRALSDEIETRERSLASVKRARQKELKNIKR